MSLHERDEVRKSGSKPVEDESIGRLSPEIVKALFQKRLGAANLKIKPETLELAGEYLRHFIVEAVNRSIVDASRDVKGSDDDEDDEDLNVYNSSVYVEPHNLANIIQQLMMDC